MNRLPLALLGLVALALPACDTLEVTTPTDQTVEVDGARLRVLTRGEGDPAVVFLSGLGGGVEDWALVQPDVSERTATVAYARPGNLGNAAPAPTGWTPTSLAVGAQLRGLLRELDVDGPVVLVGHSIGGLHARVYASTYPDDVAGLVLVDPLHEDTIDSLTVGLSPEDRAGFEAAWDAAAADMPAAMAAEFLASRASFRQAQAAGALPDVPLVVLTSTKLGEGEDPASKELARRLHARYVAAVRDGQHVVTADAGHYIQVDRPSLVRDAIARVLDRAER